MEQSQSEVSSIIPSTVYSVEPVIDTLWDAWRSRHPERSIQGVCIVVDRCVAMGADEETLGIYLVGATSAIEKANF